MSEASEYLRRVVEHEKAMARKPFPRRFDAGYIAGLQRAIKELSYFDHCEPARDERRPGKCPQCLAFGYEKREGPR